MNINDDASVADDESAGAQNGGSGDDGSQVNDDEQAGEDGTDDGSSEDEKSDETQGEDSEKSDDKGGDKGKDEDALDPTDPDYWQKKHARDEKSWKKRNSDLMSARQKAEHERDEARKTSQQEKTTPVSAPKPENNNEEQLPEIKSMKDLVSFLDTRAAKMAEEKFKGLMTDREKADQVQKETEKYNTRWAQAMKDNPDIDPAELANWMKTENIYDPVHAITIRNKEKDIEAAERRGAEKVLAKLKGNQNSKTEGAAGGAPAKDAPKAIPKAQRRKWIQETLENADKDSSH